MGEQMTNEMIRDFAEAILRLNRALEKHGFSPASEITLGSLDDFHKIRATRPDHTFMVADPRIAMERDVAGIICGVPLKAPTQQG